MSNTSTAVATTSETKLASLQATFSALDQFATENSITSIVDSGAGGFSASLRLATAVGHLKTMLNEETMKPIMELQGSALGFRTDKDKEGGYKVDVVREALIEATMKGFRPVGNEFNIIGGRFYAARDGFERIFRDLSKKGQLTNLRLMPGVPRTTGDGAVVEYAASWTFKNSKGDAINDEIKLTIPIRVNSGQGPDAVLGKAKRKMLAAIYSRITGTEITDGDVDDPKTVEVETRPAGAGPAAATAAPAPLSADLLDQLEAVLKPYEEHVNKYLVGNGTLQAGQTFRNVSESFARRILKNRSSFFDAAGINTK